MALTTPDGKNYTLGRGKIYFAAYLPGTETPGPSRYIGNTPEFSTTTDSAELEHFDSDNGINDKDDSVTTSITRTGSMTTDNIDMDNIALSFLGDKSTYSQLAATAQTETFVIGKGRYFQLGKTKANPAGTRYVNNVVFKKGAADVAIPNNFELDLDTGRFYVESDAPGVEEGDSIIVTYDQKAYTQSRVISSANAIMGELFFEGTSVKGKKLDYMWPKAKLTPNGDFNLKSGDDWATIPFNVEFLRKAGLETVYITDRGVAAPVTP